MFSGIEISRSTFDTAFVLIVLLLWKTSVPSVAAGAEAGRISPPPEQRDRSWLFHYVRQPIPDTPRNRRYLALINDGVEAALKQLDVQWLQQGGTEGYRARKQTNLLGRLAFAYRTPGLRHYHDPELLAQLRLGYRGVAEHVTPEGRFVWPGDKDMYWAGSHEHAWRLEALLLGWIWVGEEFPPTERRPVEAALQRAAEWLVSHPLTQTNNRGVVWCAVTTLCALYYDNDAYRQAVEREADQIIYAVMREDGEVGEHTEQYGGGGPDSNYSYTSWAYLYLYRLLSGKSTLDTRMLRAAQWFGHYNTLSILPVVPGASVRYAIIDPAKFRDVLPSFERFSRREPFLATIAERALTQIERGDRDWGGHIVSPYIWAMLEAGVPATEQAPPEWYTDHTRIYSNPQVEYALIGRAYQTGVTMRGLTIKHNFSMRGLQTFAWRGEGPILLPTRKRSSDTQADGIATAGTNVSKGPRGWESHLAIGEPVAGWNGSLTTLAVRREGLWTLYAFTPASAVVVYGGARGDVQSDWVMHRGYVPDPQLDAARCRVTFAGRQGQIHYLQGKAEVLSAEGAHVLQVTAAPPVSAFAFSDGSFAFGDWNAKSLRFRDASGAYVLALDRVLDDAGQLKRSDDLLRAEQE